MTILDIYTKYQIPPNLQRHQLEVTAVGRYICEHWQGEAINTETITLALLLHDMGNIIKFKRPFLGELEKDAKQWEKVQEEYVQKYGSDVHTATNTIMKELGVYEHIAYIVDNVGMVADPDVPKSNDALIADYADMCVSPAGIVGFQERIQDLVVRYGLTGNEEGIIMRRSDAIFIEKTVDVDLQKIREVDFSQEMEKLKNYTLVGK